MKKRSELRVSMPSAGYSHFYNNARITLPLVEYKVSMPSAGYSHFYAEVQIESLPFWASVNALGGLFSFLLYPVEVENAEEFTGVNALGGLFSFLHDEGKDEACMEWCQCPRRAILISTGSTGFRATLYIKVSMPSAGYSHFYAELWDESKLNFTHVSMPSAGYSHFYGHYAFLAFLGNMCQCPRRAILISTGVFATRIFHSFKSVNALGGLFSFLQYPPETRINTGFPAPFLQVFV